MVAGFTAYLMYEVITRAERKAELAKQLDKDTVVIAKRDLYMGIPISEDDVDIIEVLPGTVPLDFAYADIGEVLNQTPHEKV